MRDPSRRCAHARRHGGSRLAVDHDESLGNPLPVPAGKIRAEEALHVLDQGDDPLATHAVGDGLACTRQRGAEIDAADARQEILPGVHQNLGPLAGVVQLESGLRLGTGAFRLLVAPGGVASGLVGRDRIASRFDSLAVLFLAGLLAPGPFDSAVIPFMPSPVCATPSWKT